jgi:hypothetical protein
MLIKELDIAIINALGNFFTDLMRTTPLNHIQARPSVLRFGAR